MQSLLDGCEACHHSPVHDVLEPHSDLLHMALVVHETLGNDFHVPTFSRTAISSPVHPQDDSSRVAGDREVTCMRGQGSTVGSEVQLVENVGHASTVSRGLTFGLVLTLLSGASFELGGKEGKVKTRREL